MTAIKDKKALEEKIEKMQLIEQSMQGFLVQKQSFQMQLSETESALKELETAGEVHKIVGNIMVKAEKEEVKKELASKKDVLGLRIKTLEKQEGRLREQASAIQKEVLGENKDEE